MKHKREVRRRRCSFQERRKNERKMISRSHQREKSHQVRKMKRSKKSVMMKSREEFASIIKNLMMRIRR
jgi:hypothetical protein